MAIIGIDFGSKNARICTYNDEETILIPNQLGRFHTPTIIHITSDGYVLIGESAYELQFRDEFNTVSNFKHNLGTEYIYMIQGKEYKAYELCALVLTQLKNDAQLFLKEEITKVTMNVPIHFNEKQRGELKEAAKLAGLEIDYFINDPSASALSFIDSDISKNKFLLIDFGGTFNATVIDFYRDLIEIISHSNDETVGGDSIDKAIYNYFIEQTGIEDLTHNESVYLFKQIDLAKKYMDFTIVVREHIVPFSKLILLEICQPMLKKIRATISNALELAHLPPNLIKNVILVGGSSKFEIFNDYIEDLFDVYPTTFSDPQTFVINGTTLHYALKDERILNVKFTELSPYTFGVSVKNTNDKPDKTRILIGKNMSLPTMITKRFKPVNLSQKTITFTICQGENYYTKDNKILDIIKLDINTDNFDEIYFDITLYYSIEGVLQIEISNHVDIVLRKTILNENLYSTKEELEDCIENLQNLKSNSLKEKSDDLLKRLNVIYSKSDLMKKARIGETIFELESILNTTRINQVSRSIVEIEDKVKLWEENILENKNDVFTTDLTDLIFSGSDLFVTNLFFEDFEELDEFDLINFEDNDEFDDFDFF